MPSRHAIAAATLVAAAVAFVQPAAPRRAIILRQADELPGEPGERSTGMKNLKRLKRRNREGREAERGRSRGGKDRARREEEGD